MPKRSTFPVPILLSLIILLLSVPAFPGDALSLQYDEETLAIHEKSNYIKLLYNGNIQEQVLALRYFGRTKHPEGLDLILDTLYQTRQSNIFEAALQALGDSGDTKAIEPLIALALAKDKSLPKIAEILKKFDHDRVKHGLAATLETMDRQFKYRLVQLIRSIDPSMKPIVRKVTRPGEICGKTPDGWSCAELLDCPLTPEQTSRLLLTCMFKREIEPRPCPNGDLKTFYQALNSLDQRTVDACLESRLKAGNRMDEEELFSLLGSLDRNQYRKNAVIIDMLKPILPQDEKTNLRLTDKILGRSKSDDKYAPLEARVLAGIGAPDLEQFADALEKSRAGDHYWVIWALGHTDDPKAIEPLLHYSSFSEYHKKDVKKALVRMGPIAVRPLMKSMFDQGKNKESSRLISAIKYWIFLDPQSKRAFRKTRAEISEDWIRDTIKSIGMKDGFKSLEDIAMDKNEEMPMRKMALEILMEFGPVAFESLRKIYFSDDDVFREEASKSIEKYLSPNDSEPLVPDFFTSPKYVVFKFATLFSKIPNASDLDVCLSALDSDYWTTDRRDLESSLLIVRLINLIRVYGDKRAVATMEKLISLNNNQITPAALDALIKLGPCNPETILPLLEDEQPRVKQFALDYAWRYPFDKAVPVLTRLLSDENSTIRSRAARALGSHPHPGVVDLLIHTMNDPDQNTAQTAAQALRKLKDPGIMEFLFSKLNQPEPNPKLLEHYSRALSGYGPEAIDYWLKTLKHPDKRVRAKAAYHLGKYKDPKVITALINAFQNEQEDNEVRSSAVVAMGNFGSTAAIESLKTAMQSSSYYTRYNAARSLGLIGGPEALAILRQYENDPNDGIRLYVLMSIRAIVQNNPEMLSPKNRRGVGVGSVRSGGR